MIGQELASQSALLFCQSTWTPDTSLASVTGELSQSEPSVSVTAVQPTELIFYSGLPTELSYDEIIQFISIKNNNYLLIHLCYLLNNVNSNIKNIKSS